MGGARTIEVCSHTQATMALSSTDAEVVAVEPRKGWRPSASCGTLATIGVWLDLSAMLGVCKRTGVGKIWYSRAASLCVISPGKTVRLTS